MVIARGKGIREVREDAGGKMMLEGGLTLSGEHTCRFVL